tara:strand:+ start:193 stop:375 length:183 start_codon:yes stop_codon:yes gene_type:complete
MKDYFKMILDLLIRDKKEKHQEDDVRPRIQLEIQEEHTIYSENNQEDDEEKESSVIIIDI